MGRKLSTVEVMWVRYVWRTTDAAYNTKGLAQRFGVGGHTIRNILNNFTHRDLYVENHPKVPDAFWHTDDPEQQLVLLQSIEFDDPIEETYDQANQR